MSSLKEIETLKRVLELEDFNIKLSNYVYSPSLIIDKLTTPNSGKHPCDTAYCLIGEMARQDNYPEKYAYNDENVLQSFNHSRYARDHLGVCHETAQFVFGGLWPDDLDQAKKRAQYVLELGSIQNHPYLVKELKKRDIEPPVTGWPEFYN